MSDNSILDALKAYSARWGNDLGLVQGAGGNTSVKIAADLWVKASGQRLSDATVADIFVPVGLSDALAMADGAPAPTRPGHVLRPSIETSLHALMPHRVVAHLHMIEAIAVAVRSDVRILLKQALDGIDWGFIDYVQPGPPLAKAVAERLASGPADVLLLGNHGLIVGGADFEEVNAKVAEVRVRLGSFARRPAIEPPDSAKDVLAELAERLGLERARLAQAHLAALDPVSLAFARLGSLYPDHTVFLGRGVAVLDLAAAEPPPSNSLLYLAPGVGALMTPGLPLAAHEMAACLGLVASAIAAGAPVRTLTYDEETALLDWDAETYRRSLAN